MTVDYYPRFSQESLREARHCGGGKLSCSIRKRKYVLKSVELKRKKQSIILPRSWFNIVR